MAGGRDIDEQTFRTIKHDIKNQLSNVNLLIAQLKYELRDAPEDQLGYLEMMAETTAKIDAILSSTEK